METKSMLELGTVSQLNCVIRNEELRPDVCSTLLQLMSFASHRGLLFDD
jgi:hypothetical protein